LRDAKDHAGNAVAMKRAADLQEALPQRPAHWHPDGPSVLNGGDVLADLAAILGRQASKPIADRLGTRRRPIERRSDLLQTLPTNLRYQKWYSPIRFRCRWSSTSLSRQEACLPPYGACTLGHLNLAAFARDGQLDWDAGRHHARRGHLPRQRRRSESLHAARNPAAGSERAADREAFGGKGWFVENPKDLKSALEAAMAFGGPALVNVMISQDSARKPQQLRWHS